MQIYRARLKPRSALRTPWQADTLFGHLCWLIRYEQGEDTLDEFLAFYSRKQPPLLFSNGFPGDWLPRPLLPAPSIATGHPKADRVAAMRKAKIGRGIRWVNRDEFDALRRGERIALEPRLEPAKNRTVLKNQINRLTFGTTAVDEEEGGNLYNVDELAFADTSGGRPVGLEVSIYVKVAEASWRGKPWAEWAEQLLTRLSHSGYGSKKSVGYGQFSLEGWERFTALDETVSGTNGFISLSNWMPAAGDPTAGFYKTTVKYGKLGEELANSENPFKLPLIMLTAGSSFYAKTPLREWYGRLVNGVAPADPSVVQYAYAFAVPARLRQEEEVR